MITLSDTEIISWNEKINKAVLNNDTIRFDIFPRYSHNTGLPTISVNKIEVMGWQPKLQLNKESTEDYFTVEYTYIFSLTAEKDSEFSELLTKLRKEKIRTQGEINEQVFDIILDDSMNQTTTQHVVNNNTYVRHEFKCKALITNIIVEFYIIEKALEFVSREAKFKVNDIISPNKDRSKDYLIIHQDIDGKTINAIEIKEITEQTITYSDICQFNTNEITWSRTNRIDEIIND